MSQLQGSALRLSYTMSGTDTGSAKPCLVLTYFVRRDLLRLQPGTSLRASYAMSGTGSTKWASGAKRAICLRAYYAISGTGVAYGATL
eukprot:2893730-Rhodomonas_salina.8